jgi:hypothetical protein
MAFVIKVRFYRALHSMYASLIVPLNCLEPDKILFDRDDMMAHVRWWPTEGYGRACPELHHKLLTHSLYVGDFASSINGFADHTFHSLDSERKFAASCSEYGKTGSAEY